MSKTDSSGTVLIMALVLSVIIYLFVNTLLLLTITEIHLADFQQRSSQAFYLAETAMTKAICSLRGNHKMHTISEDIITTNGREELFAITVQPRTIKEKNSWYNLILTGSGVVTGTESPVKRMIEREIVIKPFAIFADNSVTLKHMCNITGNIHGNASVTIGDPETVTINGDVSTNGNLIGVNEDTINGKPSEHEIVITFPNISEDDYLNYTYNGLPRTASPLQYDDIALEDKDSPLPISQIRIYYGEPTANNPANVFYLNERINDDGIGSKRWTIINVNGTVILNSPGSMTIRGIMKIDPVDYFPGLVKTEPGSLDLKFRSVEEIKPYLPEDSDSADIINKIPDKNEIKRLLYSVEGITLTPEASGVTIDGSIFARDVTIEDGSTVNVNYDKKIMEKFPPGLLLVDYLDWGEKFGQP